MSTKIYNGFKFRTDTILEAVKTIHRFRPIAIDIVNGLSGRWLAKTSTDYFDDVITGKRLPDVLVTIPILYANGQLWDRQNVIKQKGTRDPSVDFETTITMFSYENAVVGILYTEQTEISKRWFEWVEDFSYWDNSDAPEELSPSEWARRRKVWDDIFKIHLTPAEAGLTMAVTSNSNTGHEKFQSNVIPSMAQRIKRIAFNQILEEEHKKYLHEHPDHKQTYQTVMDVMFNLRDSERGKVLVKERIGKISLPQLNRQMLETEVFELKMGYDLSRTD